MTSVDRIRAYIDSHGIKKSEFYLKTNLSNGYLDKVKELGADKIESIITAFPDINLYWLVTGNEVKTASTRTGYGDLGSYKNEIGTLPGGETDVKISPKPSPATSPTAEKKNKSVPYSGFSLNEMNANYGAKTPAIITLNEQGIDNIIYVPVKAQAGYLSGYADQEYIESLPSFRMPGLNNGTYRMFETEGISMQPTLTNNDRVIGQWVDNMDNIRENRVHVVVSTKGVLIKRVLNRIKERGLIYLKSDTISHRHDYPMIELDASEVKEIWYVRMKVSSDLSEPSEIYNRVADLEIKQTEIMKVLRANNLAG